jgi:hypothetical protein
VIQIKAEVGRFHGIILADWRQRSPHFQSTLMGSLQFIFDHDPRRFSRVQRHIDWIVNRGLELGKCGEYNAEIKTCSIDFQEPEPDDDPIWHVALNAMTVVHEATHGVLRSLGITYTEQNRVRIEEICVTEENRFCRLVAARAHARSQPQLVALMDSLHHKFDSSEWEAYWNASRWQRAWSALKQLRSP